MGIFGAWPFPSEKPIKIQNWYRIPWTPGYKLKISGAPEGCSSFLYQQSSQVMKRIRNKTMTSGVTIGKIAVIPSANDPIELISESA